MLVNYTCGNLRPLRQGHIAGRTRVRKLACLEQTHLDMVNYWQSHRGPVTGLGPSVFNVVSPFKGTWAVHVGNHLLKYVFHQREHDYTLEPKVAF